MTLWELLTVLLIGYPIPPEMIDPAFPIFLQRIGGLSLTLIITALSLGIGFPIGCVLAFCRRERNEGGRRASVDAWVSWVIRAAASGFVEVVRGLPIMLLVLLVFHLPYRLAELRVPGVVLAIAAFSLYSGAYFAEMMRSGFRAVPSGLHDSGRVLGLAPKQVFMKIELPLAFRAMLPDAINLAVTVFKDTSTLAVVAVAELTYSGRQLLMSEPMNYGIVLLLALFLYWMPASLVSAILVPRCDGGSELRSLLSLRKSCRNHLRFNGKCESISES